MFDILFERNILTDEELTDEIMTLLFAVSFKLKQQKLIFKNANSFLN